MDKEIVLKITGKLLWEAFEDAQISKKHIFVGDHKYRVAGTSYTNMGINDDILRVTLELIDD